MLCELDLRKAETVMVAMLEKPVGSIVVREQLEAFATAQGLQL
jgi:hypothetical protein